MKDTEYTISVRAWADDAMRFATRLGGTHEDQEDAVQEALAALWRGRERVPTERGKGYLLSCTYRNLMRTLRHRHVEQQYAKQITAEESTLDDLSFDLKEALERALQTLPSVQRAVMQLRDVEGYSYSEIGSMLELSDSQVQVYLFRARVAIRKQLKLQGYGID